MAPERARTERSDLTEHGSPATIKNYTKTSIYYKTEFTAVPKRSFAWQRYKVSDFKATTATYGIYVLYFTNRF